jgi:hypothetical protein
MVENERIKNTSGKEWRSKKRPTAHGNEGWGVKERWTRQKEKIEVLNWGTRNSGRLRKFPGPKHAVPGLGTTV